MKRIIPLAIAAAFSMSAFAVVRSPDPTYRDVSSFKFAPEPIATAVNPQDAGDDQIVHNLVDALNNDDQMKGAKITVQNEQGVAILTGRTDTEAQSLRAAQIASQFAGDGNVVNTIQPARISYMKPVPMPPDAANVEAPGQETTAQQASEPQGARQQAAG